MRRFRVAIVAVLLCGLGYQQVRGSSGEDRRVVLRQKDGKPAARYAVLVAVSEYEGPGLDRVSITISNAKALRDALIDPAIGGFKKEEVRFLYEDAKDERLRPTKEAILREWQHSADLCTDPNDTILFYFSGHGGEIDGKDWLCGRDEKFRVSKIGDIVLKCLAKRKILVLECCRSEPGAEVFGASSLSLSERAFSFFRTTGFFSLFACSPGENASAKPGGYSQFLERGLKGLADRNRDGWVSILELHQYVEERTRQWALALEPEHTQTPWIHAAAGKDIILTRARDVPSPPARPANLGYVFVWCNVGGRPIRVDDKRTSATKAGDWTRLKLATGLHSVVVDGGEDFAAPRAERVLVKPYLEQGDEVRLSVRLEAKGGALPAALRRAFEIPAAKKDQYGNPVLKSHEGSAKEIRHKQTGMEFVLMEPGEFWRGAPVTEKGRGNDETQRRVRITKAFYLGKYEVTQGQWKKVTGKEPWAGKDYTKSSVAQAVSYVSWADCQDFLKKLNSRVSGDGFRLPSEAEWEYACRAGSTTRFCYGDDPDCSKLGEHAWYHRNAWKAGGKYAHVVGQKKPNAWGLYDMHGNVWEWCEDWYGDYPSGFVTDPTGAKGGKGRVMRGGSWSDLPASVRSAHRSRTTPVSRSGSLGVRLAVGF